MGSISRVNGDVEFVVLLNLPEGQKMGAEFRGIVGTAGSCDGI